VKTEKSKVAVNGCPFLSKQYKGSPLEAGQGVAGGGPSKKMCAEGTSDSSNPISVKPWPKKQRVVFREEKGGGIEYWTQ